MPIVAETREAAQAAYDALKAVVPGEIALPYLSRLVEHDLFPYAPDGPLPDLPAINRGVGRLEMFRRLGQDGLSLGAIAHRMLLARGHWTVIGTPTDIADEMERWFTNHACDGFTSWRRCIPADSRRSWKWSCWNCSAGACSGPAIPAARSAARAFRAGASCEPLC